MSNIIKNFSGEHRFLSNFHPANITWDGQVWPTSEHAFQAAKTLDASERKAILNAKTPGDAKKLGRLATLRHDWENVKIDIMREILVAKFSQNQDLLDDLLDTGDAKLVEGNTWGDKFWGVCDGEGKNWLGKLLMEVRKKLQPRAALTIFSEDEDMHTNSSVLMFLSKYNLEVEPVPAAGCIRVSGSAEEIAKLEADGLPAPAKMEKEGTFFAL